MGMGPWSLESIRFPESSGLLPAIVQDVATGEVLMLAWMNRESLEQTLATGKATFFSRSRGRLWTKGETSGHVQIVESIRIDCDADAILLAVQQQGVACHEGYRSCFFRRWSSDGGFVIDRQRTVDPAEVYGPADSEGVS